MKKLLVVLCIAAVAFAFTSCKKENKVSCKCTGTYTLQGIPLTLGPYPVGDYSGTECQLYDWNWLSLIPTASQPYVENFTYTCKSE